MRSSLAICGILLSLAATPALAQTARVTGPCGTATLTLGRDQPATMDTTGALCTNAVSAGSATMEASSTITTGGTFQTVAAANTARRSFEFINICNVASACTTTADNCYLFFAASGSPTKNNSIPVPAGGSYLRSAGAVPTDAIQATCDGAGDHYRLAVQ